VDEWGLVRPSGLATSGFPVHQQKPLRDALSAALNINPSSALRSDVDGEPCADLTCCTSADLDTTNERMMLTPTYQCSKDVYRCTRGRDPRSTIEAPEYRPGGERSVPALHGVGGRVRGRGGSLGPC